MRLIDTDKLIDDLIHFAPEHYTALVNMLIEKQPTVDATEVVRCKDCKHYNAGFECLKDGYGIEYPQDYFCGSAERRQE